MKSLRFRMKAERSSALVDPKPNLLRRFVRKTKKLLKLQPSPTSTHTSTSSLPAAQARELTLQSSSSLHLDPVLGSAEWLNGGRHPVDALASHQAPRLPLPYHGPVYTPTPSDGASSVYSQLGLDHIDLALPALETWTSSHENLSGEPSLLPCQTEVGLYHHNTGNVGGDSSSFEEGLQLNVLDMVRRTFSNSNMRLLPTTDPTFAKLDLLRRLHGSSNSSSTFTNPSKSSGIATQHTMTSASSEGATTTDTCQTGHKEEGKGIVHARGQHSLVVANTSFFVAAGTESRLQDENGLRASLNNDAEDFSDVLATMFKNASESHPSIEDTQLIFAADNSHAKNSSCSFCAQSSAEIEMARRQRFAFAARLEAELNVQKESLEAAFENCYDTSDRLHEIDLLNLKEDHEAEVKELQGERDTAFYKIQALTAVQENHESEVRILDCRVFGLEKVLQERTQEAENLRCHAKALWQENNNLLSEVGPLRRVAQGHAHNQDVGQLQKLVEEKERIMSRLSFVETYRDALQVQSTDLERRYEEICDAYEAVYQEKERAERQLAALVEEKSKDYSWHMQEKKCILALKSEDPEQAEANATAMARELYRRETVKVLSLRNELTEVCSTNEGQLRRQQQVINDLNEEVHVLTVALDISLNEKEELVKKYEELLTALESNVDISELARGLARDLRTALKERMLFGLAFLKAEIQVVRSEKHRRIQVCDFRDQLEEKNDDLVKLKEQLHEVEEKVSARDFVLVLRDDEINKTVPVLKNRILEVEQIMELLALSAGQYQTQVITDLKDRLERQTRIAEWYENEFIKALHQKDGLKAEWDFYLGGAAHDLQLARGFRNERDALQIECLAMHERFADELLVRPLIVPEGMKTTNQIEDEQLANMHQGVLKQFLMTYKALPKWIVEPSCPGYEALRAEHMDPEKERLEKEREATDRSFLVEGQNMQGATFADFRQ